MLYRRHTSLQLVTQHPCSSHPHEFNVEFSGKKIGVVLQRGGSKGGGQPVFKEIGLLIILYQGFEESFFYPLRSQYGHRERLERLLLLIACDGSELRPPLPHTTLPFGEKQKGRGYPFLLFSH
jgi:hypothetical protein